MYAYIYMYVCMYVCMCKSSPSSTATPRHEFQNACSALSYVYVCVYIHTHTHVHIFSMHTHTHTHSARMRVLTDFNRDTAAWISDRMFCTMLSVETRSAGRGKNCTHLWMVTFGKKRHVFQYSKHAWMSFRWFLRKFVYCRCRYALKFPWSSKLHGAICASHRENCENAQSKHSYREAEKKKKIVGWDTLFSRVKEWVPTRKTCSWGRGLMNWMFSPWLVSLEHCDNGQLKPDGARRCW
jgi:hypothetical protein